MIERTVGFRASDGTVYETVDGAQEKELELLFQAECGGVNASPISSHTIAGLCVKNRDAIVDILTTSPKSRPKARAVNGAKKTRKSKIAVVAPAEQSSAV